MPDGATAPKAAAPSAAAQPAITPVASQAAEPPPGQYDLLPYMLGYNRSK